MSVKLHLHLHPHPHPHPHHTLLSSRLAHLDHTHSHSHSPVFRKHTHPLPLVTTNYTHSSAFFLLLRKQTLFPYKFKTPRTGTIIPFASSSDEALKVNGNPQPTTATDVQPLTPSLDQPLLNDALLHSLYDAARVFELSLQHKTSLSKIPWFSPPWLAVDNNAWAKALSYQASVYALLQAAHEVASRGDGGDKEVNAVVQKSLLRLSAPLESIIREKLSGKLPQVFERFWSEQIPVVVTTFVNHFERDPRFKTATVIGKKISFGPGNAGDMSLLVLALVCSSVITKLGSAKVSCPQFFSMIPDVTGSLMDVLVDLIPIHEAYHNAKEIGLQREFLVHFGPRAAACGVADECVTDEMIFWVDLTQKQLQRAIDREKIWSKLTTSESIEVLERDLAIFGFFIALGRSTRSFLAANGYDKIDEPVEGFIRYFISGCVIYYPQLSSISSYELYVEVVCEELDWLHFYPGYSNTFKRIHGHQSNSEGSPNFKAVEKALNVCSRWTRIFIKNSKWVENPSNVKAAQFLSKGLNTLGSSMGELGLLKSKPNNSVQSAELISSFNSSEEPESFDKALENVEEALVKLEKLLQEMHVSSSSSGKQQLKAACSDLEKIRKLKKEAEFLEASFRAKAACLQEGNVDESIANNEGSKLSEGKDRGQGAVDQEKTNSGPRGLWAFLVRSATKKSSPSKAANIINDSSFGLSNMSSTDSGKSDSSEIQRFELLKSEVMELEKRVQRSTNQSENKEDIERANVVGSELVAVQKNRSLIEKLIQKLKETSTDVWQGTQLLAIDTAAATGLFRRAIVGDKLSDKERKFFRRTLTDLASVIPIGVLMLLPVTAVGHAAMLAAIQRYVPALIPSTYGSERLGLLRQLEKMKQTQFGDPTVEDNVEDLAQK